MARFFVFVLGGLLVTGCHQAGGGVTAAAAEIPEGWSQKKIGQQMSLVMPPYLTDEGVPKDGIWALMSDLGGVDSDMWVYEGPDAKGRDCTVLVSAFHTSASGMNPEGAINEAVDGVGAMGGEGVATSKRKIELPIGEAWRGVVTFQFGSEAMSLIHYAGVAQGRYYEVSFMEMGAGDMALVEDEVIMESVRFD